MKKIGIVTWFGTENYGTNLQAYGLARTLQSLGYDVFFIERFRVIRFMLKHPILLYARIINKLNRKKSKAFFSPSPYSISEERKTRLRAFKEENFKGISFRTKSEWNKAVKSGMIFVAGGDILWNPARGYPAINFLDFAYYAGSPRFSFGSSVGAQELPNKYANAYRRYLGSMIEVGVREQSVADKLEPIIQRKVTKVIDPSLLITRDTWDELAEKAHISVPVDDNGYILCYFVMDDQRYWSYIKKVKEASGKQVIVLPMHQQDEEQPYDIVLDGTTYEFIWLIKNADFICTDSFHACAISLIYEKEFYLIRRTRKAEDAKFIDFLTHYHLMERIVADENNFIRIPDIDYEAARFKLEKDREFSLRFLEKALEKC